MKRYFLHDGREQTGPFELEELKKQSLTPELMVWHEGIPNWVNITMLDELKPFLRPTVPPPFKGVNAPPEKPFNKPAASFKLSNTTLKRIGVGIGAAILLIFLIRFIVSPKNETVTARNSKIRIGKNQHTENTDRNNYEDTKSDNSEKSNENGNLRNKDNKPAAADNEDKKEEDEKKLTEENERNAPMRFVEGEGNAKQNLFNNKIIINGIIKNKAASATYKDFIIEISYLTEKKTFISSETKLIKEPIYAGEEIDFRFKLDPPAGAKSCVWKVISASLGKSYQRVK